MATVDDFKAKLVGGGARPNLFKVTLSFPAVAGGDSELASFMIKAASLPSSVMAPLIVPWRGRQAKFAGDRTFEPWTITVLNDTGMEIRNSLEKWSNAINQHQSNTGLANAADYQVDLQVDQLDKAENVTKTYIFRGAFPINIGAVELAADSNDIVEEFTCEFEYQYWESAQSTN